ncbi:hypothetical protein PR202_ga02238 [Eleusine coracana subsp. coracana]|uniref:RING-type E3 ubiquitin transferase n=1 Tax=Eleusine coracana subsp. coracana TaxID=191504 RepID=A0AAV5BIY0_ELECO|nr:hypothetical protein PR202_ga02238 [Eleusine coracana subsp. coracana]
MEGDGGAAFRRWDTLSQYSFRTSVSSVADIGGEDEAISPPVDDRVFVAVPEEVKHGKSTLLWALENLAKDGASVVIAHVHCPAKMIPMMGAKVHYTTVNQRQVSCKKIIIDKDDVAKGLEEFIALHGITKLVMGAAADKRYSKKMKTPKSKSALKLMEAENPGFDADIYGRLAEAINEAQISKKEAYEESIKRRRIEQDMISTLQKVEELDNIHQHEVRQRETLNEILTRQAQAIEAMKRQHDTISIELHDAREQKFVLEQRITEMTYVIKDHEEKMAANKYLLQVTQTENEKLQQERDAAVAEAESLRQKADHKFSVPLPVEALNTEFSSFELEEATRGFDQALKIGEGGFGSVYKGFLRNTTVAVKLLHPESLQGQAEFNQEVAVLSRVRHPNLVTLIGASREAFGLVYEFLPNGSLEDRLACTNNTPPLTWHVRTRIICEMCSALIFLHSNKPHPVVHGDLKPANILLDANLVSKLGDFGICQLLMQSTTTTTTTRPYRTTSPKGTFAYMDPGFLSNGELTPRSDVYSLGIIILQLLTGQPPQNIAEVVDDAMSREELHAIIDPTAGDWPFVQANQLAHIGLRCAEMSRRRRPDLAGEVWKVVEPLMKAASLTLGRPPPQLAASLDDAHTPSYFLCPIFQEVMSDPHMAADGFTYEAEAVRGWFDGGHDTSPMTNLKLPHCDLTPNRALRSAILEWQQLQQQQNSS